MFQLGFHNDYYFLVISAFFPQLKMELLLF